MGLYSGIKPIFGEKSGGLAFTLVCISGFFTYGWYEFISSGELRFRQGLLSFVGTLLVLFYFSYLKFGLLLWNIELIFVF